MIKQLLPGANISDETAEAMTTYVRDQGRILHSEEAEPFRKWSEIMTEYGRFRTSRGVLEGWMLPATRNARQIATIWAERHATLSPPPEATTMYACYTEYHRLMEVWLSEWVTALHMKVDRHRDADRQSRRVTSIYAKVKKARARGEKEMQRLFKRLSAAGK